MNGVGVASGVESGQWAAARNVLCIRLDSLGDVLMTTPALRALKHTLPGRRITLLTSPAAAEIAALVPEIDEVITYDAPWMKATAPGATSATEYAMIERLQAGRFDAAVIFTVYSQNPLPAAFLCYMAGIPLRLAHCHENPDQLLSDWVRDPEPEQSVRHEAQRQLDLVAAVGASTDDPRLSLWVPPDAYQGAITRLRSFGIGPGDRWAVVHVGASAPSRRYPPMQFAEAVRGLVLQLGLKVVFTGTPPECDLIEQVRRDAGVPTWSTVEPGGATQSLAEAAALVGLAPLMVANNTGPMHIAAALGTPVVALYALTNPQHTPWQVASRVLNHDVPCKFCYKSVCPLGHQDCLRLVTPQQVVDAARELLEAGRPARAAGAWTLARAGAEEVTP